MLKSDAISGIIELGFVAVCDKADGCMFECGHKVRHELMKECCIFPCPINAADVCRGVSKR